MPPIPKKVVHIKMIDMLGRHLVYPSISVKVCRDASALTSAKAKELMGWEEESASVKFGDSYTLVDNYGVKVRCNYNAGNRPLSEEWAKTISQDILNRRWKLNLETIIVGKYGNVLSGQHRLIALILAWQSWAGETLESEHWKTLWPTEPVIETLLAFGAEEDDEFIRTLDNTKPRTLADVLYTSSFFSTCPTRDRKTLTRVTSYALKTVWQRTGAGANSFVPRMTNSESIDFLSRHMKILDCVKHVYGENHRNGIQKYISLGYAAGLMYMMATSDDDYATYTACEAPSESSLTLHQWGPAQRFWSSFSTSRILAPLRESLELTSDTNDENAPASLFERIGMIVKAWNLFKANRPITVHDITVACSIDYSVGGLKTLEEYPTVGGLDVSSSNVGGT